MATPSAPRPTPENILATLTAYQQTAALKAAIELDIFTKIAAGASDSTGIAKAAGASERGIRILCDFLTIKGFLTKENGKYSLSPDSAMFLDKNSRAYMGSIAGFLTVEEHYRNFAALADTVRKGTSAYAGADNRSPNDPFWVKFAESMAPITAPIADFISKLLDASSGKAMNVLDIAAGHGMYGITIALQNPNAQITGADWPAVIEVARKNAERAGVASRYSTRPGSAFEGDLGSEFDVVLLTNILHHFDPKTCETLLKRVHSALKPRGKAVILEFVPNNDRVTPPAAAGFSIVMLANTDGGDAYTFAEYETMLRNAGFGKSSVHPTPGMPQQVILAEK